MDATAFCFDTQDSGSNTGHPEHANLRHQTKGLVHDYDFNGDPKDDRNIPYGFSERGLAAFEFLPGSGRITRLAGRLFDCESDRFTKGPNQYAVHLETTLRHHDLLGVKVR
jgi:hypothetical protein